MKFFARDKKGAAMVEYALLVGLIAIVSIGAITAVGTEVRDLFQTVADALAAVNP